MGRRLNGRQLEAVKEQLRNEFEMFAKVQRKMEEPTMTVDRVKRVLGVSRRQVVYWYTKGVRRAGTGARRKQAWHRFSIVDLIGFGALKELRGLRVPVEGSVQLLEYISENLTRGKRLLYPLARGEQANAYIDGKQAGCAVGIEIENAPYTSLGVGGGAMVFVSLGYIFKEVMSRVSRKDFKVRFVRAEKDKGTRVVFYVDGEKIELTESLSIALENVKPKPNIILT